MWGQLNATWDTPDALRASGAAYGVCANMEPRGVFEYLAGVQVTPTTVAPQGMTRWEVPAQIYAVFPCTLATIHQAYERAYQVWLPCSGYERSNGPDSELYPDTFEPNDPYSQDMSVRQPVNRSQGLHVLRYSHASASAEHATGRAFGPGRRGRSAKSATRAHSQATLSAYSALPAHRAGS
jgi:predicted transcriptional regulator YdeE